MELERNFWENFDVFGKGFKVTDLVNTIEITRNSFYAYKSGRARTPLKVSVDLSNALGLNFLFMAGLLNKNNQPMKIGELNDLPLPNLSVQRLNKMKLNEMEHLIVNRYGSIEAFKEFLNEKYRA